MANVFKKALPLIFQRKILIDGLVVACMRRNPVDFDDYKRLRREQREVFLACQKYYFPNKKDG